MAQNITLLGASYSAVPAVTLPKTGGGTATFTDVTDTTAAAPDVASGKYFYAADGTKTQGTSSGGGGADCPTFFHDLDNDVITCNKTYSQCKSYLSGSNAITTAAFYTMQEMGEVDYTQGATGEVIGYGETNEYIKYFATNDSGIPALEIRYDNDGTLSIIEPPSSVKTLTVTQNGTYNANFYEVWNSVSVNVPQPSGSINLSQNGTFDVTNYASAIVNVAGTSKNTQVVQGTTRTTSSTLTAIGAEMTVSKTGTYDVYWSAFRSTTSGSYTYGTRLYIDGTAYGTENTTWSNHVQNNHLSNVSLTKDQKVRVYGRESRGSSYYIYAPTLVIVEA